MSLAPLDYVVIAVYGLAMLGIGLYSVTIARGRDDYLLAGRRLGFPLFFGCMAAMAVGGAVTVGGAKKGYETGIAGIWVGGSLGLGLILLGLLITSKLSRMRALSINEVIERNYGVYARVLGALLTIVYTIALTVVQVIAIGDILASIFSWDLKIAMLVGGSVVVFYTFLGGMWAVTLTDIVQFVIKTLGIMILVPIFVLASPKVGGLSGMVEKLPSTHWDPFALGFDGTLYWILLYVPGLVIGQDIWQRMFTARNEKIARTGTIIAGIYSIVYGLAAVLLGMAVLAAGTQLGKKQTGQAFSEGVMMFLPQGLAGLLLAAAMAAAMSVASGTILACSTVVYNDIFLRFVRQERDAEVAAAADDREALSTSAVERDPEGDAGDIWINRVIAFVIGLVVIGLAMVIENIFAALDLAYGFLSGCVFVPVIATFFLRKVSPKAGLISLALSFCGVAGSMIFGETGKATALFGAEEGVKWAIGGNYPIMVGMAVGLVVYIVFTMTDRAKITPNLRVDEVEKATTPAKTEG
ncbi:solute:Na+ symporter, SSS family [Austwickia chelonae]|uniref:Putative sodium/solute symporter n=1 Tax=Austwickia chelonae NBRC 105200 TaxID=1184607 RepID=K6VQY6_9MICO|nr:sodium:solute symporter [Austwickia chelonae]GAB77785.1 putative sodium/solute symporter [Austwickia chelonae NBRC 105200]SEV89463.1 solute:Na+ symporter, SSS family [Austwickia chelonae]